MLAKSLTNVFAHTEFASLSLRIESERLCSSIVKSLKSSRNRDSTRFRAAKYDIRQICAKSYNLPTVCKTRQIV